MNREKNISLIFSSLNRICNEHDPDDSIEALSKSLTFILVLNVKERDIKDRILNICNNIFKNYKEMHEEPKSKGKK